MKSVEAFKAPRADKKPVTAHRFTFTPEKRGDYTFVLAAEPIFLADQKEAVQDIVKVVLHVQTQNGWDRRLGDEPCSWCPSHVPMACCRAWSCRLVLNATCKLRRRCPPGRACRI